MIFEGKEEMLDKEMKRELKETRKMKHLPVRMNCSNKGREIKIHTKNQTVFEYKTEDDCHVTIDGPDIKINIKEVNDCYLNWFWAQMRNHKLPMEWMYQLYPDVKEITESTAALFYLYGHLDFTLVNNILVIADGSTPRTAGLIACKHTNAKVWSIDPDMKEKWLEQTDFTNLYVYKQKIEDFLKDDSHDFWTNGYSVTIVAVHSHAIFQNYIPQLLKNLPFHISITIFAMPCCVFQNFTGQELENYQIKHVKTYYDWGIHSVKIWTCQR